MRLIHIAAALILTVTMAYAQQTSRIRGTVESLNAEGAIIKTMDGQSVSLKFGSNLAVAVVVKAQPSDIKPGAFIGAGARPQADGTLKAIQILIFPEAQRGTGEGHRDWSAMPQTTMTNATVAETVSNVSGPELTLKYKDGEKKLVIGADANIITTKLGEREDLKVGTELVTTAVKNADGTFTTSRVTVGKDGVAPPL